MSSIIGIWSNILILNPGLRQICEQLGASVAWVHEGDKPEHDLGRLDLLLVARKASSVVVLNSLKKLSLDNGQLMPPSVVIQQQLLGFSEVEDFMQQGARGFMSITADPDDYRVCFEAVLRENIFHDHAVSVWQPQLRLLKNAKGSHRGELTSRERQILKMTAEGGRVKEIATELGLSEKTVGAHKFNLMRKLDVHDKVQLVHYAIRVGIIPSAPAVYVSLAHAGN